MMSTLLASFIELSTVHPQRIGQEESGPVVPSSSAIFRRSCTAASFAAVYVCHNKVAGTNYLKPWSQSSYGLLYKIGSTYSRYKKS